MKYLMVFLFCLPQLLHAQQKSTKRGLGYGHHSASDLQALSAGVSWWYNWSEAPESTVSSNYTQYGFDFVPMAWNGSFNETKMRSFLAANPQVKYLLAFNEPNFIDQANMTPSQAVAQWHRLESIATDYNLKIVGPAVNFCGNCVTENGIHYTDPVKYLDDFFAACTGCRVDYIAIHSYMNTVSAFSWYLNLFKKYNKPIWVTEYAGWEQNGNINNVNAQINYMIGATDIMEADTSVFRYAWFIGRTNSGSSAYPYIDLLAQSGTLTPLGQAYVAMPVHDTNYFQPIPAMVEAEKYTRMKGILLERTSDISGFAHAGYIEANDWLEYQVSVAQAATYVLDFRVAVNQQASFEVQLDGVTAITQNLAATGGFNNWTTLSNTMHFPAGQHTLRIRASSPGFNLNSINIRSNTATAINPLPQHKPRIVSNPVRNRIELRHAQSIRKVELFSSNGQLLISWNDPSQMNVQNLAKGLYLLRGLDRQGREVLKEKILVE